MTAEMFEDIEMDMESGDDSDDDDGGMSGGSDQDDDIMAEAEGSHSSEADDADNDDVEVEGSKETERKKKKSKRAKDRKEKKNKKLSNKEMLDLEEKQHSFDGNLHKVQIEELIKEVSINESTKAKIGEWVEEFKNFVVNLKPSKKFEMAECEKFLKPIPLPLPEKLHPGEGAKGTCQWEPPASVDIIGSWKADCAVFKISEVDLAVVMPSTYLNKSDYLNHKYHVRRAAYLAYIAKMMKNKRGDEEKLKFTVQNGNPLKPVLEFEYTTQLKIRIHALPPKDFFKAKRFSHDTNNLRFEHFFKKPHAEDEPEYATPNYNFSVLTDLLVQESKTSIYKWIAKSPKFKEAVKLLKVWLHQRSLCKGFGAFSGFLTSAYIAYLASTAKINDKMSSYEILRISFVNLTKLDWTTDGISMCPTANVFDWHLQFDVVFLDTSGLVNYASDMSKLTYKRVQFEAQRALATLDGAKVSGFQALFITQVPFMYNFDHILQIRDTYNLMIRLKEVDGNDQLLLNHSGYAYPVAVSTLSDLFEKCLRKRVQLIDCELTPSPRWNIIVPATNFSNQPLRFGFIIIREEAYKAVEKCESEDHEVARIFKEFWGEKSELRRFKDGTMSETVVFKDKNRICFQMLNYILVKHLGFKLKSDATDYLDCQMEDMMEKDYKMVKTLEKPKKAIFIKGKRKKPTLNDIQELVPVSLDDISNQALSNFDELSKILRSLTGLPLEVTTVQGTSSILRFTNVHPTPPQRFFPSNLLTDVKPKRACLTFKKLENDDLPPKVPKVVEPINIVLHLETSGKWPDDIRAIERLKCAFLIRIGQLLKDQFGLAVQPYPKHLDILKNGFVFRIKLTYYRELTLLKQQLGTDGVLRLRDNPDSLRLEKDSLLLPQLTTTLHSFHRQFEAFGKTCRLAKRWLASQLLLASPSQYDVNPNQPDFRFTEESVELLVAHVFLHYAPHISCPNEPQVGFLRFLYLLANTDWTSTPIILNFHDKMTQKEISAIELDFVRRRDQLPTIFISTPEDKKASVWTKNLDPVIIGRALVLAANALESLKEILEKEDKKKSNVSFQEFEKNLKIIFRPDTSPFDVLIRIKKEMNPKSSERIDAFNTLQFKEYTKAANELMPIVDFDPVQIYLKELRDTFGHMAVFLHDNYGGDFIAVVWRENILDECDFSVSRVNCRVFDPSEEKLTVNIDGVMESFELLGKGIVKNVELISHDEKPSP